MRTLSIPKPHIIAAWIIENGMNLEFIPLEESIAEVLQTHLRNSSSEEIAEISEMSMLGVRDELYETYGANLKDGIRPCFEISSEDELVYIRFCERPELALLSALKENSSEFFEKFCADVLERLGATSNIVGGSGDGGVDFIGFNLPLSSMGQPNPIGATALVIGQAKRYTEKLVSENEIRNFIGGAIKRKYMLKKTRPSQVGFLQPVVYAFWTTSDLNKNARIYSQEMGLWYLSGIALTQLALRIGITEI